MRSAGLSGKSKGGAPVTTRQPKGLDLRPDLVNQAIVCAKETTGLIHHSDHGSQGGFNWLSQHPEHGGVRRWLPRTGVRRP
ncbi:hypothetical protein ACQX2H_10735, partial [Corynebacterium diphtheriae]